MFIKLSESKLWDVDKTEDSAMRVPVAVLGSWKHPEYGKVTFDQKDFDQILNNWNSKVAGFEPPLFVGHPSDEKALEGAPAVGFPTKLYQEDNVLFGIYEPVDDEVYNDVAKGKYRYSSAEIVRNAIDKETGEEVGTLLVGLALTNRPFLTGMPRVETTKWKFSDSYQSDLIIFPLNKTRDNMTEPQTNQTNELQGVIEEKSTVDKSVENLIAERFSEFATKIQQLEDRAAKAEKELAEARERLSQQKYSERLNYVQTLNLPKAVKEEFAQVLETKSLTEEAETKMLQMLEKMSADNYNRFTSPVGYLNEVSEVSSTNNPYADIIKANQEKSQKLSDARERALLNSLSAQNY